jgi:hypothetical protein
MKRKITSKKLVAIALALATIPVLVGCGSNNSSSTTAAVVGSGAYYSSGTCVPITQPIYFSGSGVSLSQSLTAGTIPNGAANGTITVGSTPLTTITGQTFVSNDMAYGSYSYGDISVTLSGAAGVAGSLYGTITISPYEQQQIEAQALSLYSGTSYGAVPCVSGVALQGYLDTTPQYPGFEGVAYIYLNNQPHGVILQYTGVN